MNIVACYKWVLDEQDIKVVPGSLSLDMSRAKGKISEYDKNVIEEAVLQAEKHAATVTALTFGNSKAKQSLKDALSRGPAKGFWVNDAAADIADGFVTANVLTAAVKKIGEYDLILFGEGSSDVYGQQVGPRVAALLGIPVVTFATKIEVADGKVTATRKLGDCTEDVTVTLPAVITLLPEVNKPRIPGLKQVLGASKKPVEELSLAALGLEKEAVAPKNKIKSIRGYAMDRKNEIYAAGTTEEKVAALVSSLTKEGLL
jgi:Electron transfer flavoprotein, beta subunit